MGRDVRLSERAVEGNRNFATKLWNAARFARMNDARFGGPRPQATLTVNRWILGETARVREAVDDALHAYRFDAAASALYAFTWGRVCDWYLELAKPLLDGEGAEETRAVMGWVIDQCLILLHPVMPFVTEALWGELAERERMLVHEPWPEYGAEIADREADRETEWVIGLIEAVRSVRGETGVPAGARVPMLEIELGEAERGWHERNAALIGRLARIASVERAAEAPKGAVTIPVPGGLYALPLADVIDIAAERARLEKSLTKLGKELGGLRGRLGNPKFLQSAPEAVVAETRANLAAREAEEAKLRAALARLAEVA
jgi:valyl-tRNA synthetase